MLLMMPKKTARVESTEMTYTIVDDLNQPVNENHALPSRIKSRRISNSQIARPRGVYRNLGKRLIDIAILGITAPILLPVLAIVWLITVRQFSERGNWQGRNTGIDPFLASAT